MIGRCRKKNTSATTLTNDGATWPAIKILRERTTGGTHPVRQIARSWHSFICPIGPALAREAAEYYMFAFFGTSAGDWCTGRK